MLLRGTLSLPMAASHETLVALNLPQDELGVLVERAGRRLEAETDWIMYGSTSEGSVRFTTPRGWFSAGERLRLEIEERRVRIVSRSYGLKLIDYGKNRRNVEKILKALLVSAGERLGESLRVSAST